MNRKTPPHQFQYSLRWMLILDAVMALTAALTIAGFFGNIFWWLGIWESFRYHYFVSGIIFALIYLCAVRWKMVLASFTIVIINFLIIYPQEPTHALASGLNSDEKQVKIVTFNLQESNGDYKAVRDFLRFENADLVILVEATPRWKRELASLSNEYPYSFIQEHGSYFGLALLSKKSWSSIEYIPPKGANGVPILKSRFKINGQFFTLIGTKTFPPTSLGWAARRNNQLSILKQTIEEISGPVILAGDLNATPWSAAIKSFRQGSIKQWREGPITPSWPSLLGPLGIQIDHIMVNAPLRILSQSSGPYIGSDHLPLIANVGF